jgi:hypothetical protein
MKIYCQKCGNATEYSFDKPKFCSGCGSSFVIASSFIPKTAKPVIKITHNESEEEISVEKVPHLDKLDFEINVNSAKGIRLNNLIGTHNGQATETTTFSSQKINKEQAMEDFKREAGHYPARQSMNEEE